MRPGSKRTEPGLTGMGYSGSRPLRYPDPRNGWQETAANHYNGFCLERSVVTVQTEPLQPFGRIYPSFLPFETHSNTDINKPFFCNSSSEVKNFLLSPSFLYSGCSSKIKTNILLEICLGPTAFIILWRYWLTTVRPYGDLVVLSKYREGVLYLGRPTSSNPLAP